MSGRVVRVAEVRVLERLPALTESMRAQLRAEAYNLTNTPYFAQPNVTVGAGTFGRITAVSNSSRQMQVALKFYF